jgi:VWFA-related protein
VAPGTSGEVDVGAAEVGARAEQRLTRDARGRAAGIPAGRDRIEPMRRARPLLLALAMTATGASPPAQDPVLSETLTVERALVDVRVIGRDGHPVTGLGTANFSVTVDGHPAEITSVDWFDGLDVRAADAHPASARPTDAFTTDVHPPDVGAGLREADGPPAAQTSSPSGAPASPAAGSLTVLFFQRSLEPLRVSGLMRALPEARRYVAAMRPHDRIAILAHEYRLHLVSDFSSDRERLLALLDTWARFGTLEGLAPGAASPASAPPGAPSVPPGEPSVAPGAPALATTLTAEAMRAATEVETALLRVGEALEPLPGPKDIVFFAWGMGRFGRDGVSETRDFDPAIAALRRARASLLTVDVLQADRHSLEGPLREAARETGGLYVKSYPLSGPLGTVRAAAAGRYVLALRRPASEEKGKLRVRLVGVQGTVLAPERLAPRAPSVPFVPSVPSMPRTEG